MPELTDEEIAGRVQKGDPESFGLIMQRYSPKLLRYAGKFLFNNDDGQDLVQDVFIKAYTNIKSFDPDKKFSPWIYRIAHNEFINALKKKSRSKLFFVDLDVLLPHPIAAKNTDADIRSDELKETLEKCLDKLKPKYREIMVLYFFEEMNYKEIAEILRIPVSTVGVRLQRGKKSLQKIVKKIDPAL